MSAIPALGAAANAAVTNAASLASPAAATAAGEGFSGILSSAIGQVNAMQTAAEQRVTGLLAGDGGDIHAAALSVERASLAFDLMLQVRNKVVSAYQEIERLQF
jgi:flagellar hook-basal body complex protein FliE